jgi:hypothetical protein
MKRIKKRLNPLFFVSMATVAVCPTTGIGWINFAAVAMETKKEGGIKTFLDSIHQTS